MTFPYKGIWILLLGLSALGITATFYIEMQCVFCSKSDLVEVQVKKNSVELNEKIELKQDSGLVSKQSEYHDKPTLTTDHIVNEPLEKKKYEDDWCKADVELSEDDYHFAKAEVEDWNLLQGKSRAKSLYATDVDEHHYPNNSMISSYEELPLEQLEELAIKGDKWAMITFVQNRTVNKELKNAIAQQLLVQGSSYYALEYLVTSSLAAAKTSYRRVGATQETIEHITKALTYVYWGVAQYNDGGLNPFIGITSNEPFKSKLPLELILPNIEQAIETSYTELERKINEERATLGVISPDVPKAVKRMFSQNISVNKHLASNTMDILSGLDVTNSHFLKNNACVDIYLADLKAKLDY